MKKVLSVVLIMSILFCLSACGKQKKSDETSKEPLKNNSFAETNEESQVTSSNNSSDNNTSSVDNTPTSGNTETSSNTELPKEVYPEKVLEVYSFKNQFRKPEVEKKTFYDSQNGVSLPYRLFMPHDYNPSKKYPVILFLHGAGEIGNDNEDQLTNIGKMFTHNGDLVSSAFLICPQSYEWWNFDGYGSDGTLSSALRLLDKITNTYSCDTNRIYVTGLSMGGYATWDLLENYGYRFAAGIPVCGGGNSHNGSAFVDIPIRIFHGTKDPTVGFASSQSMYNAILNAGGKKVEFFPLEGVNHNAWDPAYSDRDTFCWLLAQDKVNNPTCEYEPIPYLKITDSNGTTIISDEDIHALSYMNDYEESGIYTVDFILSDSGKNKLNRAYKMSGGGTFTFYCGTQKVYTFTASGPLPDNVFSIRGIFDKIDYQLFFDTIESIVYN